MFQATRLSHADLANGWTQDELARFNAYMTNTAPLWQPPTSVGHSDPPAANDPLASLTPRQIFQDCIWISDEDSCTKLMLLCVARFLDKDLRGSSMSYSQIAKACSFSEATAKRCAKAVRDRWLCISVGKGRYVPGKGCENLYHGVVPPEVAAELRRRKLKGEATPVDERLEGAAKTMIASMIGVSARHLDHSNGVSDRHPEANFGVSVRHRGVPQTQAGCPTDTLTLYTHQEEKEDIRAGAPSPTDASFPPLDLNLTHGGDPTAATPPPPAEPSPPTATAGASSHPRHTRAPVAQPTRRRITPRTSLRSDWVPSAKERAWVADNFVATDRQISIEAEKFRDYHLREGSTMADWSAAWRTWWGNEFHKIPRRARVNADAAAGSQPDCHIEDIDKLARNPATRRFLTAPQWCRLINGQPWDAGYGPPPGHPRCDLSSEVIQAITAMRPN